MHNTPVNVFSGVILRQKINNLFLTVALAHTGRREGCMSLKLLCGLVNYALDDRIKEVWTIKPHVDFLPNLRLVSLEFRLHLLVKAPTCSFQIRIQVEALATEIRF